MKHWMVLSTVAIALGAFAFGRAGAQEGPEPKACDDMAAWLELGKTGPEHAELMKGAGTWTVESRTWTAPGAEPVRSKGKAVFTALLGGRYLKQEYEGDFFGQPFRGIGCTGFNNATKRYEDVWIDSMGTGMMQSTGTETAPGVLTFTGGCTGPGGKMMKTRTILKRLGADRTFIEAFVDDGSGEAKCWEATYTRSE